MPLTPTPGLPLAFEVWEPVGSTWCPYMYNLKFEGVNIPGANLLPIRCRSWGRNSSSFGCIVLGHSTSDILLRDSFRKPVSCTLLPSGGQLGHVLLNRLNLLSSIPLSLLLLPEKITAHKLLSQALGSGIPRYRDTMDALLIIPSALTTVVHPALTSKCQHLYLFTWRPFLASGAHFCTCSC